MSRIVLASSSPYRKELLERLQLEFECYSPEIDETAYANETSSELVKRLSAEKAQAVATHYPQAIIIGSDQVAACGDKILGKPGNFEKAAEQLRLISNKKVTFHTGLSVFNSETNHIQTEEVLFDVSFRELNEEMIKNYLNKEPAFNCAGAFKSESLGITLTKSMSGNDPTALIGLPLIRLTHLLENAGIKII